MPSLREMTVDDVARFLISIGLDYDGLSFEEAFGSDAEYYAQYGGYECENWQSIEYSIRRYGHGYDHLFVDVVNKTGGIDEGPVIIIFKVSDADIDRYFRKSGYYTSYDGYTWDGEFVEVTPIVRPTTFYEEV